MPGLWCYHWMLLGWLHELRQVREPQLNRTEGSPSHGKSAGNYPSGLWPVRSNHVRRWHLLLVLLVLLLLLGLLGLLMFLVVISFSVGTSTRCAFLCQSASTGQESYMFAEKMVLGYFSHTLLQIVLHLQRKVHITTTEQSWVCCSSLTTRPTRRFVRLVRY